ncbi:MAG: Trk system potassium transporter TrkA [bacterium]
MKIVILGAGQVGSTVAYNLASESNDITVIDQNGDLLRDLADRIDLRTIEGYAAHPDVLRDAGADDADMIIAVTNSDELNMVACQVAYTLFRTPKKIARVRAPEFSSYPQLFNTNNDPDHTGLPINLLISPEQLVTDYIHHLLEHPGALQVLDFAGGLARLVAVRAVLGGPLVGHQLKELNEHLHKGEARVAAIYRRGVAIQPKGETVIESEDEVFFIASAQNIQAVIHELGRDEKPFRRLIIAGGGNIGQRLAKELEKEYKVKVIERDLRTARRLSERLHQTLVLNGNAADKELLREENIEDTDVFCAVTNDDEANILSAMLAKRLGARKVMALINRAAYVDLVEAGDIDIAISPQQATIGSLLTHVRRGNVVAVHSLRRGAAEAIEAIAVGDSTVVGKRVQEIALPRGVTIAAIVRGDEVMIAHHDTLIQSGDHVILFLVNKRKIAEVEKLFSVGITFA